MRLPAALQLIALTIFIFAGCRTGYRSEDIVQVSGHSIGVDVGLHGRISVALAGIDDETKELLCVSRTDSHGDAFTSCGADIVNMKIKVRSAFALATRSSANDHKFAVGSQEPRHIAFYNLGAMTDLQFVGLMSCSNHEPAHTAESLAEMQKLSEKPPGCSGWKFVGAVFNDERLGRHLLRYYERIDAATTVSNP